NRTFAPSVAEFCGEADRIAGLLPYRNRQPLSLPVRRQHEDSPAAKLRMRLKMPMWRHAMDTGRIDELAGVVLGRRVDDIEDLMALAQEWSVPIPERLWDARASGGAA